MQLHESEENVFENMLYQIKDNSLEEPLVPMSEEVEMLRRSFIGGITNTLVRSSMDIKATEELSFMNNDMANTSLFDLVVEEQRSSIPKKSKVQLRKSNLSCEGDKTISVPSDYNKKLLKTASKKSTIRKSDGAKESFDLQSKSRDSKVVQKSDEGKVRKQLSAKVDRTESIKTKEQSFKSSKEESVRISLTSEEENLSKSSNSEDNFRIEIEKHQDKNKKANKTAKPKNKKVAVNKPKKTKSLKFSNKKINKFDK